MRPQHQWPNKKARIKSVQFGILPQDEIEALSAVKVTDYTLHHRTTGRPDGLLDSRFGAINRFQPCGTCGRTITTCPSHPGHIELPVVLPHVAFKDTILQLLTCVCCNCSALLATPNDCKKIAAIDSVNKRLTFAFGLIRARHAAKSRAVVCPNEECKWPQPKTVLKEPYFLHEWDAALLEGENFDREFLDACFAQTFNNTDAMYLLRSIAHKDLELLGFNPAFSHPADMMLKYLIVPGSAVRPTLHQSDGSKRQSYSELTKVLACIAKYVSQINATVEVSNFCIDTMDNNLLPAAPGPGWSLDLDRQIKALYVNISAYFYPKKANVENFTLRPYDAKLHAHKNSNLIAPLQGSKFNRLRQNIQGKRTNWCMRTVVTPFPDCDVDEVGIPEELADIVTIPERVNRYNIQWLQQQLRDGLVNHIIVDPVNAPGDLTEVNDVNRQHLQLRIGQIAERVLQNGDYVVLNRQPTLHKPSAMAHRVVRVQGKTIKLSTSVMTPYNADCDGDEMNVHVMQSVLAQAELEELMSVHNNLLHPGGNRPVAGLIQDNLVAVWSLTSSDTWLSKSEVMNLLMHAKYNPHADPTSDMRDPRTRQNWLAKHLPPRPLSKPCALWSGKQLVSMLLPDISVHRHGALPDVSSANNKKEELIIDHGLLLTGQLCKKTMGTTAHGVLHYIALYLGYGAACRFLSDIQRVAADYFAKVGFSMGIQDCVPAKAVQPKLKRAMDEICTAITDIEHKAKRMREIPLHPDDCPQDRDQRVDKALEIAVVNVVKTALDTSGNLVMSGLDRHNAIRIMTQEASSKGSVFNAAQIVGCLGQTFVEGGRPFMTLGTRGGRFLPSSRLPDCPPEKPELPRRVLQAGGFIDRPYSSGLNSEQVILHAMGGREGLCDTTSKTRKTGYLQRRIVKAMETLVVANDSTVRNSRQSVFAIRFGGDGYESNRLLPVAKLDLLVAPDAVLKKTTPRTLFSAEHKIEVRDCLRRARMHSLHSDFLALGISAALPFNMDNLVPPEACVTLLSCRCFNSGEELSEELRAKFVEFVSSTLAAPAAAHLMWALDHKTKYCNNCLEWILEQTTRLHNRALIQPGDCIGVMAATSLGEPSTQLTLTTFHFAGSCNDGMTYGVPRALEVVDASKNMKSPCVWLPLEEGTSRESAEQLATSLVDVSLLSQLVDSGIYKGVSPGARATNEVLFEAVDVPSVYLEYSVMLKLKRTVNIAFVVSRLHDELKGEGLVLTDETDVQTVHILIVRNQQKLNEQLHKATDAKSKRAGRRYRRALRLPPGDWDTPVPDVPLGIVLSSSSFSSSSLQTQELPTIRDIIEVFFAREVLARLHSKCSLSGTPGVSAATVRTQKYSRVCPDTGAIVNVDRFLLDVRGNMLEQVFKLPFVDVPNVVCNNVHEIYNCMGIDAAAQIIFHELRTCFEVGGIRTDDRLIALLVNVMTHWGYVMPITRYGLNRLKDQSIIAKATFEEVIDMFFSAAIQGQADQLLGPSEAIMFGNLVKGGTGMSVMLPQGTTANRDESLDDLVVISVLPECPGFLPPLLSPPKPVPLATTTEPTFLQPLSCDADFIEQREFVPSSPIFNPAFDFVEFRPTSPDLL